MWEYEIVLSNLIVINEYNGSTYWHFLITIFHFWIDCNQLVIKKKRNEPFTLSSLVNVVKLS